VSAISPRELVYAGLFGAAALMLPVLFHLIHLGSVFLPMYLPLMVLAFLVRPAAAALTAAVIPILSAATTGMPPWYPPVAPAMSLELAFMAAAAAWLWRLSGLRNRRRHPVRPLTVLAVLIPVLLFGRLFQFGFGWVLGLWFDLPPAFLSVASLVQGLPGLVLMVLVVPGVVALAPPHGGGMIAATGREERRARLQAWFDERAAGWDEVMPLDRVVPALRDVLSELGLSPDERVLDVGCGTGVLTGILLEELGPQGRIDGIDLSPAMIERARASYPDGRVRFQVADAADIPLPEASVDRIVCFAAWPHFEDPDGAVREIYRLLRPGGRVHVWHVDGRATIDRIHREAGGAVGHHRLEPAVRLARRLTRAGFSVVETLDRPDHYRVSAVKDGRR
jgi:SAM-dependent methyltransferase